MCWKGTEGGEGRKEGGRNDGAENELREATEGGRDGRRAEPVFGEGGTRHLYSQGTFTPTLTHREIGTHTHQFCRALILCIYLCLFYLLSHAYAQPHQTKGKPSIKATTRATTKEGGKKDKMEGKIHIEEEE